MNGANSLASVEAIFVPGDPPRTGSLALWRADGGPVGGETPPPKGAIGEIDLVLPTAAMVRRRRVPACLVPVRVALPWLVALGQVVADGGDADVTPRVAPGRRGVEMSASLRAWAIAAKVGAQLVA